jgi:hypothetical protein
MADLITQSEFARRHGVSRQAVNDWVTRGVLQLVDGKLDEAGALEAIAAVADPARPQRILISGPGADMPAPEAAPSAANAASGDTATPDEAGSFHAAKTRRERAQAELAEMRLAEKRRELAPITVLEDALSRVAREIAVILEAIPVQLARTRPTLSSEDLEAITAHIAEARNLAAEVRLDWNTDHGPLGDLPGDHPRPESA